MSRYIFDIETNGFLDRTNTIHSLVLYDIDKKEVISCAQDARYMDIGKGLILLQEADEIIGHNILKFDIPAIQKLHPSFTYKEATDTLTMSRLIFTDMWERDYLKYRFDKSYPPKLRGKHSLKSWGYRLEEYKGDFAETNDWSKWTKDMQDYCEQDVLVNYKLYKHLMGMNCSSVALELEHEFQKIIHLQEQHGIHFAAKKASTFADRLKAMRLVCHNRIREMIPDQKIEESFTPRASNKAYGYTKGVPVTKQYTKVFNPSSRQQIIKYFGDTYQWKPTEFTEKKQPKIDDTILKKLPYKEAPLFAEHFELTKIIGFIEEGTQAWLKLHRNGVIHGNVITNGARTGRCTHFGPNIAQTPSNDTELGRQCRELFIAPKGQSCVGADASGIELRILAHYLTPYDQGKYTKLILEGDIHTANQEAAGLTKRSDAKTFIYAFIYGAGDVKLGSIVEPAASEAKQRQIGRSLRQSFLTKMPAIGFLINDVKYKYNSRGYLVGLDGRKLKPKAQHTALNTLVQGGGAIVMKQATVNFWENYNFGEMVSQVAHIHDEIQTVVDIGFEDQIGKDLVKAIEQTTEDFKLKCPMAAEYKVGTSWSETH